MLPTDFGSPSHMRLIWRLAESCWCFARKGSRTRGGRWFQVFQVSDDYLPWFSVLAMVLEWIGLHEGWVNSARRASDPAPGSLWGRLLPTRLRRLRCARRCPESPGRQEQCRSGEVDEAVCELQACCVQDRYKSQPPLDLDRAEQLDRAGHKEHGSSIVDHKTLEGSAEWLHSMATGKFAGYLRTMFDTFNDTDVLVAAGLLEYGPASEFALLPESEACKVVSSAWTFAIHMAGAELLWLRRYTCSPQYIFALLDNPSTIASALDTLKTWWEVLQEAEAKALEGDFAVLRTCLRDLQWPSWFWVRELFVGLSEIEFAGVPKTWPRRCMRLSIPTGQRSLSKTPSTL